MTVIKMDEIRRLKRYRARFENDAMEEQRYAENLYVVGDSGFIKELNACHQHLGAMKALDYMIEKVDPETNYTLREKQDIIDGILQRGIGVSVCCAGIGFTMAFSAFLGIFPLIAIIPGSILIKSNKRILIKRQK